MTNMEKMALKSCAERLENLASLENAGFSFNKEEDAKIKEAIKPYMSWFECVADYITEIVEMDDEKDRYWKKYKLEEIIRYNR